MELHHLAAEWATDQMIKLFRGAQLVVGTPRQGRQAEDRCHGDLEIPGASEPDR